MQPSALDTIKALDLYWNYSKQFGTDEIDVTVPYVEFDSVTEDPDVLLCDYYGLDYDQANCFELV